MSLRQNRIFIACVMLVLLAGFSLAFSYINSASVSQTTQDNEKQLQVISKNLAVLKMEVDQMEQRQVVLIKQFEAILTKQAGVLYQEKGTQKLAIEGYPSKDSQQFSSEGTEESQATFAETFDQETSNPEQTQNVGKTVEKILEAPEFSELTMNQIDCRDSACRIELYNVGEDDSAIHSLLIEGIFGESDVIIEEQFNEGDDGSLAVMYLKGINP